MVAFDFMFFYMGFCLWIAELLIIKVGLIGLLFKKEIESVNDLAWRAVFFIIPTVGFFITIGYIFKEFFIALKEIIKQIKKLPPK